MKIKTILTSIVLACSPVAMMAEVLPYQNPDLSPEERAADLCSRPTLEEHTRLMMNTSPAI